TQGLGKALEDANRKQAEAAAKLARKQAERALIFFAISSFAALALCAAIGLGLITAMCEKPPAPYIRAIDVALTGLIIGAGTKPLHDLISRVEKAKEKADGSTS
ncbi:MAG TPA: hypothetical protein VFW48_02310, partial [Solirubrobacterales bacterium]|nr:hypothetical protein [Solirubrobacterales bacterium]